MTYIISVEKEIKQILKSFLGSFWLIFSVLNTPGYNTAKFLKPIVEHFTHNEFTLKNSFSFAKKF